MYKIVKSLGVADMEAKVNELLKEGYFPAWGLLRNGWVLLQALWKGSPADLKFAKICNPDPKDYISDKAPEISIIWE